MIGIAIAIMISKSLIDFKSGNCQEVPAKGYQNTSLIKTGIQSAIP